MQLVHRTNTAGFLSSPLETGKRDSSHLPNTVHLEPILLPLETGKSNTFKQ
jgi:hypothetical protein